MKVKYKRYKLIRKLRIASWRNWIARMTSDHKVGGSSPSGVEFFYLSTKEIFLKKYNIFIIFI